MAHVSAISANKLRIKLFKDTNVADLEKAANNWLAANENPVHAIELSQTAAAPSGSGYHGVERQHSVLIVFQGL